MESELNSELLDDLTRIAELAEKLQTMAQRQREVINYLMTFASDDATKWAKNHLRMAHNDLAQIQSKTN